MGFSVSDADHSPLDRIMDLFALSKTELGSLFGVSGRAIEGWQASRVPSDRRAKLGDLLELADLLERKVKPRSHRRDRAPARRRVRRAHDARPHRRR